MEFEVYGFDIDDHGKLIEKGFYTCIDGDFYGGTKDAQPRDLKYWVRVDEILKRSNEILEINRRQARIESLLDALQKRQDFFSKLLKEKGIRHGN